MIKNTLTSLALLTALVMPLQSVYATSQPTPTNQQNSPDTPIASFANLKNNAEVQSPFRVAFAVKGMKVVPAGTSTKPGTGHFHLLIDTKLTEAQQKMPIPNDATHLHFGNGQSEVTLNLPKGKHTLQIVMGDGVHKLHNPPVMSEIITVTVK